MDAHAATQSNSTWNKLQNESDQESQPLPYRYKYHLVLLGKSRKHVLAEALPDKAERLPALELDEDIPFAGPYDSLEKSIREKLGISVYIVRGIWNGVNREIDLQDCIIMNRLVLGDVLDYQPVVRRRLDWIHRSYASTTTWGKTNADEDDNHVMRALNQMFEESNGEKPVTHPEPWMNAGWYESMTLWTCGILEPRNMVITSRIRRRVFGSLSVVMTCEVKRADGALDAGDMFYIKNSLPSLREPERTAAAAEAVGNIVPEVIGADYRRGLLLQRNVGSVVDEPFDQHALVSTVLKMQTSSMKHISELEAAGLRVRDFGWLEENIEPILNHDLLDKYYQHPDGEEDKEQIFYVRSKADMLRKKCRAVMTLGLPRTLVHGDLDLRNIGSLVGSQEKMYRVFDWANAFIGNPLHDFDTLLRPSELDHTEVRIDTEKGLRQVCEHWKLSITVEEMNEVLLTVSTMSVLVGIHDLMEQYQAWDDRCVKERDILFQALQDQIAGLSV